MTIRLPHWIKHHWGNWKETNRGNLLRHSEEGIVGRYVDQERKCEVCGFIEINQQKIYIW